MRSIFKHWLGNYGVSDRISVWVAALLAVLTIALIYTIVAFITRKIILGVLESYIKRSSNKWDDILLENKVFERLSRIVPVLVIYLFAPVFPTYQGLVQRIVLAYMVLIIILVLNSALEAVEDIYWKFEVSKTKPIKGYLQVIQMIVWVVGLVIFVSVILDRSPLIFLSGIGAATAVLLLIFQNSILGLVASIQLSANNMLKIGDWISMPSHHADGAVLDVTLHTVKVQNWDKSIVTIPTYKMTAEAFTNWKGMTESGTRRIKRSIYIDMSSIQFCTEEMLERFEEIEYLAHYLAVKKNDIRHYNKEHHINHESMINGRHLTNIGTFRAYVESYLQKNPHIAENTLHMVRQLQPTEKGLPIEIYAFTNDAAWVNFENIQADVFDHILAIIPEFDLRIYQDPAGHDLKTR